MLILRLLFRVKLFPVMAMVYKGKARANPKKVIDTSYLKEEYRMRIKKPQRVSSITAASLDLCSTISVRGSLLSVGTEEKPTTQRRSNLALLPARTTQRINMI